MMLLARKWRWDSPPHLCPNVHSHNPHLLAHIVHSSPAHPSPTEGSTGEAKLSGMQVAQSHGPPLNSDAPTPQLGESQRHTRNEAYE